MAAVLCLVTLGTITTASAYWSGSGGGSGPADTGTTQAVVLGPATGPAQLLPGGQSGVSLTASNPNQASVVLGSLAVDTSQGADGFAVDAAHSGCSTSSLSFATQTNDGAGWSLPAGAAVSIALPASLSMSQTADNACQGASFTVYLKAGP